MFRRYFYDQKKVFKVVKSWLKLLPNFQFRNFRSSISLYVLQKSTDVWYQSIAFLTLNKMASKTTT